jgi:putative addiction module component (TIGR02574 family)
MVDQALRDRVRQLTPEDRLELISELWDSLDPDDIPVTRAEREMLDQRLDALRADPGAGRPWESVKADLRDRR